jgi:hypothetical protein
MRSLLLLLLLLLLLGLLPCSSRGLLARAQDLASCCALGSFCHWPALSSSSSSHTPSCLLLQALP